ncbi:PA2169 family four-helix-bundle protein [Xanthomonadaceae bacterium XH05]|nr:PA2169 family four-helix-bundle protein [Xanthomonadaceae bacterium XH05]
MSESLNILPELIEASREGVDFYAEAADAVKDSELSKLFRRMAEAKSTLVEELSQEVGARPAGGKARAAKRASKPAEWVAHVNATYTALRGGLKAIKPDQVTQIEQAEADLLGRVQRIRHDRDHSYVVRVLAMQYEAKARVVHEGLRARKRRLTA